MAPSEASSLRILLLINELMRKNACSHCGKVIDKPGPLKMHQNACKKKRISWIIASFKMKLLLLVVVVVVVFLSSSSEELILIQVIPVDGDGLK
jgi:hypothetical protein